MRRTESTECTSKARGRCCRSAKAPFDRSRPDECRHCDAQKVDPSGQWPAERAPAHLGISPAQAQDHECSPQATPQPCGCDGRGPKSRCGGDSRAKWDAAEMRRSGGAHERAIAFVFHVDPDPLLRVLLPALGHIYVGHAAVRLQPNPRDTTPATIFPHPRRGGKFQTVEFSFESAVAGRTGRARNRAAETGSRQGRTANTAVATCPPNNFPVFDPRSSVSGPRRIVLSVGVCSGNAGG